MTYPMDEFPQDLWDSAAAHFGPGEVDPYLVMERAQLFEQQQQNEQWERAFGPSDQGCFPIASTPLSTGQDTERRTKLLDDQEDAYDFLLDDLSGDQRDALLILAEDSGVGALAQLLDVLREERRRKRR